jgi:cell division protease FtsH
VGDEIDEEVAKLLKQSLEKAEQIITENKNILEIIAKKLLEVENLEREQYEAILDAHGVNYKNKDADNSVSEKTNIDNNHNN